MAERHGGSGESLLRWHGAGVGFRPAQAAGAAGAAGAADAPGEIKVVDSWLVADGRVLAFDAHERRFGSACAALAGIDRERTREFLLAAMARVPDEGRWFPRAELAELAEGTERTGEARGTDRAEGIEGAKEAELADRAGGHCLRLRIRPAPPKGHSVRLWISPSADARTNPAVKGPDLDWLAAQRGAAAAAGADEAVLLSPDGRVLEGSTTSILWWRDGTLCAPPEDGRLLPSTTRDLLLDAADAAGVPVSLSSSPPGDLSGLEVWAVNALHGIRPVTDWVGTDIAAGPAARALRWQVYLDGLSREVRPGPAEAVL